MNAPGRRVDLSAPFRAGECTIRPDVHEIESPQGTVRLEPKAMGVLLCLASREGEVVERQEILDTVWRDAFVTEEVLTHCIWELRKAFGDSARQPTYIRTVPRKGYRFLLELEPLPGERRFESVPSLAVLPFRDLSPTADSRYFCDGMVEELTHALSRLRGLRVLSRTSALQFQAEGRDLAGVGAQLGVDLLLEGSIRPAGDGFRTLTRLVEVSTGFDLWAEAYHHGVADVFRIQQEIARSIVTKVHGDLISGIEALGVAPSGDVETYRLHLKARHAAHERKGSSLARAAVLYREALDRDDDYPPALAGLAQVRLLQAVYGLVPAGDVLPEAKELARRALALAPDRADTHAALAFAQAVYDWAWGESEDTFREAMATDPYAATGPHWYGINCLTPQARFDEARYYLRRAQALDPLSAPIHLSLGLVSYFEGLFADAAREFDEVLTVHPGYPVAHLFRGLSRSAAGDVDGAFEDLRKAVDLSERSTESLAGLAYAAARDGREPEAREILAELEALERYVSPALVAQVHAGLGESDEALDRLEEAADVRAADLAWIKVRPVFADLAGDPRYGALLDRLDLG